MVTNPLRVLIAEDNEDDVVLALDALRRHGYEPQWKCVETAEAFTQALQSEPWDVVLSDYSMPAFDALNALKILQESELDIPFIIVSGTIGEDVAVEALKLGSNDYILKFHMARLGSAVEHEIRDAADRRKRRTLESFSAGQVQVLEMIINGRPIPVILDQIAQRVESLARGDAQVTILLRMKMARP
jgi:DNA-binding NtrC family response regulator